MPKPALDPKASGTRLWGNCAACLAALSAGAVLPALIVRRFGAKVAFGTAGSLLLDINGREAWEAAAVAAALVLAFAAPRFGRKTFGSLERRFSQYAANRTLAIFAAGLFPVILRLSLLPAMPIPQPYIADEFGYLLLADTFASGRITNPTHPMWHFFESLYVFHQPTYSSLYPIAQGLMMAAPMAVGLHPWFGILMSAGLMCAALCWMLQGWLPPKWALLGALIAGVRFDVVTSWMNSYWGGATTAFGGALLLGALPRLLRQARIRDALLAGAGLAVLSQSRPFEGILLSLPVGALLLFRLLVRGQNHIRVRIRVLAALAGVSAAVVAGGLYYNWRVTSHALLLPYQLHQQIYGTPQNLSWQRPVTTAARVAEFNDIREVFEWQLGAFEDQSTWSGRGQALKVKSRTFWDFYLQPVLSVPLLLLPVVLRRNNMRFLFGSCLFVLLAEFVLYPFFFPHYTALLCGPLLVLVLQGARYLRTIRWRDTRVGDAAFRWFAVIGVISSVLLVIGAVMSPAMIEKSSTPRSRIKEELERRGGKHLVVVHYTPRHNFHEPWIYNSADVDRSPVVWARELSETSMLPLLRYYADRQVWLVNADSQNPRLTPYEQRNTPQISAIQNAAGKGPYIEKGVSPGSLATLYGLNLGNPDQVTSEGCVVSGIEGRKSLQREVKLPGLDGARPNVPVLGRPENIPRMALGQSAVNWGGVFVITGGPSKAVPPIEPNSKRLSVRFGDLPAQVLCIQQSGEEESATVLVPLQLRGEFVDVVVRSGDHEAVERRVPVLPANPGILQLFAVGKRAAALLRPDGSWVSPRNRARRGETVRMFVTGIGPFNDAGPKDPIIVGVNDRGAPLEFVNCAECPSGIAELGFQVPQDTPAGDQIPLSAAVVVAGKNVYSNPSVIAVQ
jgi:uncharacterized protein (TIGR03437 family)